jgi:two-component system response regulator FixJ
MNDAQPVVFIVDDDEAIRESLVMLMETEGLPARAFASAHEFLRVSALAQSGCLVTDIRMPDMSGMELLARMKQLGSRLPVVIITAYGDVPVAVEAMKLGAADFLEKPYTETEFVAAVRAALDASSDLDRRAAAKNAMASRFARLSTAERRVFAGLLEGKLNKTTAFEMGLSLRTVEALRANVMAKIGAENLSDLVRAAMLAGMDRVLDKGPDQGPDKVISSASASTGPSATP